MPSSCQRAYEPPLMREQAAIARSLLKTTFDPA
jgi:hypothetical protein